MRFEIFAADQLIGSSELEEGDAPMGVASGRMIPGAAYVPALHAGRGDHGLRVRPAGAPFFEPSGVYIEDHSAELGPQGLVVTIVGLGYPAYAEHFPHHVKAYEEQFHK